MSASEGARPKRRIKPVYDPDFVYDLPVNPLFSDNLLESQLDTRSAPSSKERPPVPSSKSKASTSPLSANTIPASTLTFDQQLQLVELKKEKLESVEIEVLERQRERPLHSMYSELHLGDASTKDPIARFPHCVKEAKTNDHKISSPARKAGHMSDFKRGMFSLRYFYSWASRLVALAHAPSTQKNISGAKRFLEQAVSRKSAITPHVLHGMVVLFDFSLPQHAAMWTLFLVAFFTLLRKSN